MDNRNVAESNAQKAEASRTRPQKRLIHGQRVSACGGPHIGSIVGERRFLVKFDNEANPRKVGSQVLKVDLLLIEVGK